MSLFKVKHWWSNSNIQNEENVGVQSVHCLKVDRFISHSDSDCILIGEGSLLKIYKPNTEQDVTHTLLECHLGDVVLQVETGKFIVGCEDRQVLVLHPRSYAIYQLKRNEGHTDAGDQNSLAPVIKHSFTRRADSLTCGPFGSNKTRDFICILGLDGSLSFFDQDTFLFMCIFDDIIVPVPVCYVANCDSFVICKSTWVLEIYSYQQLREFSELTVRQNKKNIPQWIYNAGEEITHVQVLQEQSSKAIPKQRGVRQENVITLKLFTDALEDAFKLLEWQGQGVNINGASISGKKDLSTILEGLNRFSEQTSSNFSSILALGERHLYCFQDNGLMKSTIKFEFMPTCFYAYLIGWYYEPAARLLVMVASDDSKLYIYESTTLLWCCALLAPAISISRCFLKNLPGGLVTLSAGGILNVGYLGTEPDLNGNVTSTVNEPADPQQVQAELEDVEESLQKILENQEDTGSYSTIDQILQIKADVGKPIQNLFQEGEYNNDISLHLLMCPVIVILTCEEPKLLQSVQITYVCCPPFECSESTICLDSINGTEIIESQVFLTSEFDISETRVKILFTVTDSTGKISILSRKVLLPFSLYCSPVDSVTENKVKICVEGNHPCIEFTKIFTDFTEDDLANHGETGESITFAYRSSKKTVTIKSSTTQYFLEADEIPQLSSILDHFIIRLTDHYRRMGIKDFSFRLKYDQDFVKLVILKFLKSIEFHAKERIKLKNVEDELNILQKQFVVVQKKLLVQYGSLPPGNCDPLEYLMKDTHRRLIVCVSEIITCRENVCRASSTLTTIGHFIIFLLKQVTKDDFKLKLIEEMMTLTSLYEHYQEWEEAVAQALTYILNSVIRKSEKEKEKLATVTEQAILSQINLKRFLKQLRIVLDRMFTEAVDNEKNDTQNVTRIEELVEVL